jgi:hypothetical protein
MDCGWGWQKWRRAKNRRTREVQEEEEQQLVGPQWVIEIEMECGMAMPGAHNSKSPNL